MAFHTISYELKREHASIDFGITLGGILYIGWLGSYLISLRMLPDGLWWMLLTIPTAGIGDAGAYFIGVRYGKKQNGTTGESKKTYGKGIWVVFCSVL